MIDIQWNFDKIQLHLYIISIVDKNVSLQFQMESEDQYFLKS